MKQLYYNKTNKAKFVVSINTVSCQVNPNSNSTQNVFTLFLTIKEQIVRLRN